MNPIRRANVHSWLSSSLCNALFRALEAIPGKHLQLGGLLVVPCRDCWVCRWVGRFKLTLCQLLWQELNSRIASSALAWATTYPWQGTKSVSRILKICGCCFWSCVVRSHRAWNACKMSWPVVSWVWTKLLSGFCYWQWLPAGCFLVVWVCSFCVTLEFCDVW